MNYLYLRPLSDPSRDSIRKRKWPPTGHRIGHSGSWGQNLTDLATEPTRPLVICDNTEDRYERGKTRRGFWLLLWGFAAASYRIVLWDAWYVECWKSSMQQGVVCGRSLLVVKTPVTRYGMPDEAGKEQG